MISCRNIAHRGASGTYPENTIAAFRAAEAAGAQGIELDVHLSSDGAVVVIHDDRLERTTNGTGLVRHHSRQELQALDAGNWFASQFAAERIPLLDDVMAWSNGRMLLFVEIKAGTPLLPGIEEAVVELIRSHQAHTWVQVSSFDHVALQRIKQLDSRIETGLLYTGRLLDPVQSAQAVGAAAIHPEQRFLRPELITAAHAAGLAVHAWTVDDPERLAELAAWGVDGLMSNFPERIK